jgi:hypothetical protein
MAKRMAVFLLSLVVLSCASSSEMGGLKVVEESSKKPDWVKSDREFFEKEDMFYFRGMVSDRYDLALAKREAKAEAVKNIAEKIAMRVRDEFRTATEGVNVSQEAISQFVSDAVSWITDNLNVFGLTPERVYWRKVRRMEQGEYKYTYDVFVLVSLPKQDYIRSRNMAIRQLMERYRKQGQEDARKTAEAVFQRLIGDDKR